MVPLRVLLVLVALAVIALSLAKVSPLSLGHSVLVATVLGLVAALVRR